MRAALNLLCLCVGWLLQHPSHSHTHPTTHLCFDLEGNPHETDLDAQVVVSAAAARRDGGSHSIKLTRQQHLQRLAGDEARASHGLKSAKD